MNLQRIFHIGKHWLRFFLAMVALVLAISVFISSPVHAAGTVTDCAAYDDGNIGDGADTLGEALIGGGTVTFSCNNLITVPTEILLIGITVEIDASSQPAGSVILDGAGTNRIFFKIGGDLTLNNVTVQNGGSGSGATGIYNPSGTVTLNNSTVRNNNNITGDLGGGILNGGTMTLNSSTVSGNVDQGVVGGGGIYNTGNLTLNNSTVSSNSASNGGGIYNGSGGTTTLNSSTVSGNGSTLGGGIFNTGGTVILNTNSTISGNGATTGGGGIYNIGGTTTLTDSTVSNNTATSIGGGIVNIGALSAATLNNSTVSGNAAGIGGGISNTDGTTTLSDSIVSGNSATQGGGIDNLDGAVTLSNSTSISGNLGAVGSGINNDGTITNEPSGTFTNDDTIVNNAGRTITNNGTINNNNIITNSGAINNSGTINNSCTGVITGNAVSGTQPIGTCATTTTLISSQNPSNVGDPVTFTATVTPSSGGGTPTGTVTFSIDGVDQAPVSLNPSGQATLTTNLLSAGLHTIDADYSGDATFAVSTGSLTQTVSLRSTTTTLISSLNPSNVGDLVTFTATVTPSSGGGTPTGTVTFSIDGVTQAPVSLDLSGQATLTTNSLSGGAHTIDVGYSGDATFAASTGSLTQVVNLLPTTTTLFSSLNPSVFGDTVTFTAIVMAASGTPAGDVNFVDTTTGTTLGFVTLDGSGQAAISINILTAGSHDIEATYNPDPGFGTSSASLTQVVIGPPSATINQGAAQPDPTNASPIIFDVVFSEAVTGFDGSDIDFTGSTVGGTLVANVTGSGTTYTVEVSGMTGTGNVVASIPAGAAQDGAGNLSLVSTSTDNSVTFDSGTIVTPTPPVVVDLPAPPATPHCEDLNFIADGVVRAITSDEIDYAVFCRVLYANGAPMQWLGGNLYNAGSIGHQGVLDLGVVQAVDVYSPVGLTEFEGGVEICLKGTGSLIFMAASGAPRVPVWVGGHEIDDFPGFTCATLFEPGTLVLVRNSPAA